MRVFDFSILHNFMHVVINPPLPYTPFHIPCSHFPNFPSPISLSSTVLSQDTVFEEPVRRLSEEEQEKMGLQYYDSDVHKASFTLPRFARKVNTW